MQKRILKDQNQVWCETSLSKTQHSHFIVLTEKCDDKQRDILETELREHKTSG